LTELPGVPFEETTALRRSDLAAELDFLALPLTDETVPAIRG